jgi:hypothetical protein
MQTQQGKFPFLPYLVIGVIALAAGIGISSAMIPPVTSTTTSTTTTTLTTTVTETQQLYYCTVGLMGSNGVWNPDYANFYSTFSGTIDETVNGNVVMQITCG